MASHDMQVATASPADIAADMDNHRKTYGRFLSLLKYTIAGATVILIVLFLIFD